MLAVLAVACLPAAGLAGGPDGAVVNNPNPADRLNLRAAPSVDAASLGKYYNGVGVELQESPSGGWVKVRIGEGAGKAEGYMQTRYLAFGDDRAKVKSAIPLYSSTSSAWQLYHSPRVDQHAYDMFGLERMIEVLGVSDHWWHVRIRHHTGFVQAGHGFTLSKVAGGPAFAILTVNNPNPADRLHLRTAPRATAPSLGKYYSGVRVEALSRDTGGWVKVRIGDTVGYMRDDFLHFGDPGDVRSAIPVMRVNNPNPADRLNLRKTASDNSESLGKYYNGATVEVLGAGDVWYHVRVGEYDIGYMMAKFLR